MPHSSRKHAVGSCDCAETSGSALNSLCALKAHTEGKAKFVRALRVSVDSKVCRGQWNLSVQAWDGAPSSGLARQPALVLDLPDVCGKRV